MGTVSTDVGFLLETDPDTVRGPDVAFVAADPIPPDQRPKPPYRPGAPDLAVEVLSPSNRKRDIAKKVELYLRTGSRLVWVVDPPRLTVTVHRTGEQPKVLARDDTLLGYDVLPDFVCAVALVFDPYGL